MLEVTSHSLQTQTAKDKFFLPKLISIALALLKAKALGAGTNIATILGVNQYSANVRIRINFCQRDGSGCQCNHVPRVQPCAGEIALWFNSSFIIHAFISSFLYSSVADTIRS